MKSLMTILLVPLLATSSAEAEQFTKRSDDGVRIDISVDRTTTQVVDPIRMDIVVTARLGTTVVLPEVDESIGEFHVHDVQTQLDMPTPDGNQRQWTLTMTLDTLKSGELTIPAVEVQYRLAESNSFQAVHSDPIPIRVASLLKDPMDPSDFCDIQSVVDIEVPTPTTASWGWWALGGAAVLASIVVIVLVASRRSRVLSPSEAALHEIEQLGLAFERQEVDSASVFGELADVIRGFHEVQCVGVASHAMPEFVSIAEEVKFANLAVDSGQVRDALASSRAYVTSVTSTIEGAI